MLFRAAINLDFIYSHLILSQRSSLVCADNCRRSHRFTGVHLAYKIVGLEHTTHGVSQGKCDSHRQSFWYCNDDERHADHDRVQEILQKVHPCEVIAEEEHRYSGYKDDYSDGIT